MALLAMPPARFTARQRAVLLVLLGAGFMLSVDFSILTVALPRIGAGVGLALDRMAWVTTAFVLPAAGLTLVCGRLADLLGRRRVLVAGMALLLVASLLGGLATDPATLLTARALQGVATAMTLPAALSILTTTFAEGAERDRVMGLNGALLSGGFTVGSLIGGALVGLVSWRAAFLLNVPVALVILVAAPLVLTESRSAARPRLDLAGAVTVTGGLLAVVYAVIESSPFAAVLGAVLLVVFRRVERGAAMPLAPPGVLARRTVRWGNVAGLVVFATEPAMIYLTTLHLQRVLGLAPLATGLVLGVPGLASVVAGMLAGRVIGRVGARRVLVAGLVVQALATVPLIVVGTGPWALGILVAALFVGFCGHVPAVVAFTVVSTSGLPDREQGLATGLATTTQQVGITIGIPVLAAIAATQAVETAGTRLALAVDVAVTLAAAALVHQRLRAGATGATGATGSGARREVTGAC